METLSWLAIVCTVGFILVQSFGMVIILGDPTAADFALILLLVAFEMRSRLKHERS